MKRLFSGWSWEHWYNLAREDIEEAFASVRRVARIALYAGLALWVLSGFHIVRQNEVGLTTYFGRLSRGFEKPGLRYRFPWPIGSVRKVPVETQQLVTVGVGAAGITAEERLGLFKRRAIDTTVAREFDKRDETQQSKLEEVMQEGQRKETGEKPKEQLGTGLALLTADHNVIMVQAYVQYLITNPMQFIYASEGAPLLIERAATQCLLEEAARTGVDSLLTTGRAEVQEHVKSAMQEYLRGLGVGVEIAGVQLQRLVPPEAVAAAFRNVSAAREERTTNINEAEQYKGQTIPQAQGEAAKLIAEAEGYRADRIAGAKGEASRFAGVLREFRDNPEVTGERLRIETIEAAISRAKKVQVGGSPADPLGVNLWVPTPDSGQ